MSSGRGTGAGVIACTDVAIDKANIEPEMNLIIVLLHFGANGSIHYSCP